MSSTLSSEEASLLDRALRAARDTRVLSVEPGARHNAAREFTSAFGTGRSAVIVADTHTFKAAGADVLDSLTRAGIACEPPFVFGPEVYAEYPFVETLQHALASSQAIPLAIGSGTINDLAKLAAHRVGRPYMTVACAASMDGYTAYGASITLQGSKQTFDCPAPLAVLADLDVIAAAPSGLNASGYADLLAKGVAGADWILADALGEEPIDPPVWATVQSMLPSWVESPSGIALNDPETLRRLVVGLMMSGFAMQEARTSRPASGAEHQFSHLWDMQHHTHLGSAPSHGFKVGIGTLASLNLYNSLLKRDLDQIDPTTAVARWPSLDQAEARIADLLGSGDLASKAVEETRAKYPAPDALLAQIERLKSVWPSLRDRLSRHLLPFQNARAMLDQAGCPSDPEQIGISRARLRSSYEQAYYIRRRFTVLDLAMRLSLFESSMDDLFGPSGPWAPKGGPS